MTDLNKAELRRLAESASKGPWWITRDLADVRDDHDELVFDAAVSKAEDARFVVAANPAAILALLDEIDSLERRNRNQSESIREYQDLSAGGDVTIGCLRADLRFASGERDDLRAEVEALRKDAERWKCVRNAIPMCSPYAIWREGAHVVLGKDADDLVDNFLSQAKEGGANG